MKTKSLGSTWAQVVNPGPILCLTATLFFAVTPSFGQGITISYNAGDGCSGSTTSATFSATCTGATLGAVTTVAAEASLTFLKLSLDSAGTSTAKSAEVRVTDTITVTGGSGSGTLVWVWAMDGTLDAVDAGAGSFSQVYLSNFGGGAFADFRACAYDPAIAGVAATVCAFDASPNPPGGIRLSQPHETVNATRSISIPFVFGTPLTMDWRLTAAVLSIGQAVLPGPAQDSAGTVDFFNTLQLQPLLLLDGSGAQVPGGSVLSNSGFSYAVVAQPQTITVTQGAPATAAFNTTFPLSATAPGGPVAIAVSGVCSFSAGVVTMTSATGTCTMTFDQAGGAGYLPAPQVTQTTTAQKASQVITVTQGAPATALFKQTFLLAATAPGGAVVIAASGACSLRAGTLTMKKPNAKSMTCTVTFNQVGDVNYLAAPQVVQTTTVQ
jgi:hypothetical protein